MPEANQNPVASVGREGAQEFNDIVSGNPGDTAGGVQQGTPPGQQQQTTSAQQQQGQGQDNTQAQPGQQAGTGVGTDGQLPAQGQAQQQQQPGVDAIVKSTVEAVMAGMRPSQQQQQANAGPKSVADLTPAEFNQRFNVTRANKELVTTILGQDPDRAAAALDQYGQNLVRQAVTMAMEVAGASVEKLRGDVTPHLSSWQAYQKQARDREAETEFFAKHTDLANEKELVYTIKDSFMSKVQSGELQFANREQAFSAVATAARQLLTKLRGGNAQAPQTGQRQNGGAPAQRQMSAASTAGRPGSGQAAAKSDVETIFGDEFR